MNSTWFMFNIFNYNFYLIFFVLRYNFIYLLKLIFYWGIVALLTHGLEFSVYLTVKARDQDPGNRIYSVHSLKGSLNNHVW